MSKIQKTICREELKSRIPGLFAYIEENDAGEFKLHKATDSLSGCYGKIIENMTVNASLKVNGEDIITSGNVYSYRTIMNAYYQYKNNSIDTVEDTNFFKFVDDAIGKVEIDFNALGLDEENNDMVPHYIYLANARNLFNQYSKLKIVYDYYTGGDDSFDINTLEGDICCLCAKYRRMGGTIMYNKLEQLISDAESVATTYYGYVANGDNLTLKLNVSLKQSIHDIGYLSCYLHEWVGGEEHFKDELYTYNGCTYRCMENNHDKYNEELMRFEFDDTKFKKITDLYDGEGQEGLYNKLISSSNPFGNKWVIRDEDGNILTDDKSYNLYGSADSKLKSLRKYKNYINGEDKEEKPSDDEDWLYFYRKGVVINYTTVTDNSGNIADIDKLAEGILEPATDVNKLAAYGNVISNIEPDPDQTKRTITFEYYINAHLKATTMKNPIDFDDDGNPLYKFDGFYFDETDKYHGVKYTETYTYDEGGELDKLVNGQDTITFDEYVNDIDDSITTYNKYPFRLTDSIVYYNKELPTQIVSIPFIKSDYETTIKNETDYLFAETFKTDYLGGITYKPTVDNNVRIDRGNYSAFERHLKLAEVKTLNDLVEYSNGSFFNVQKVN